MTPHSVLITGADRGLGRSLAQHFARKGWRVFAGRYLADWPELTDLADAYPQAITLVGLDVASDDSVRSAAFAVRELTDRLDMIVNNAGVTDPLKERNIREGLHYDDMMSVFDVNALGALRVVDAFRSLLDAGETKRLCFVSSEAGSIGRCERDAWYGYCMSKTALNMGVKLLFNTLRPQGYTFRLFHPGWMKTYMSGEKNIHAELEPDDVAASAYADFSSERADEGRLVMLDWRGCEWPW